MEKLLQKLAEQLDAIDEESLMTLWNKYAELTYKFEPTKRWENAALILCLIQAKHMKNRLFNHHWALRSRSHEAGREEPRPAAASMPRATRLVPDEDAEHPRAGKQLRKCRKLAFVPGTPTDSNG